jgi:hypothetical protein
MRTPLYATLLGLFWPTLAPGTGQGFAQSEPIAVEAGDLDRRADLVGKIVAVDDRVKYYQNYPGHGYSELLLKRTDVVFRLPPPLRPESPSGSTSVLVQGRLGREGRQLVCDVTAIRNLPRDTERVDQAVAALSARDFENRKVWAGWAEKRGKEFKDGGLLQRARSLWTEAMRLEAEQKRSIVDAPAEWLRLADDARRRNLPEAESGALVHKAIRARLGQASKIPELDQIKSVIELYFPKAVVDQDAGRVNLARWEQSYANDPYVAYQRAPADIRRALDRRIWADALAKRLQVQAAADPLSALSLIARAETELPERPQLAEMLLRTGLDAARQNLGALRKDEVKSMGRTYREKLGNPQAELDLYRSWLKVQRDRLSDTDAEGPIDLAPLYEELLQDKAAAKELLERAWKIDAGSKAATEALRTRGYQRVGDHWVEVTSAGAGAQPGLPGEGDSPKPLSPRGLRGRTPEEVTQQMGSKPDRKVLSGTKGQIIEQWIFLLPQDRYQFVNFLRTPGEIHPRVVSDYVLSRRSIKGEIKPGR